MWEKITNVYETEKSIEALKLEATNAKSVGGKIVFIYAVFCAIIACYTCWDSISDWISNHFGSKSDDFED